MTKPGPLCYLCPLKDAPGPVFGNGPLSSKAAFIGSNPEQTEIQTGLGFSGGSGRTLTRGLYEACIERNNHFVTNVVKCFVPAGTPPPQKAIDCCRPLLDRELDDLRQCTVLVTLGAPAFYTFSGKTLTTVTNKKNPNAWLRGCPYLINGQRILIPLVHPAYLGYTAFKDWPIFQADLLKVKRWIDGKGVRYEEHLNYSPTSQEVREYVHECIVSGRFATDIETPESVFDEEELTGGSDTPIQVIGISANRGEAVGVPPDLFDLLTPLFNQPRANPTRVYAFNWGFDGFHLGRRFGLAGVKAFDVMLALNLLYSDLRPKDLGMALSLFTDMPYTKNLSKIDPNRYNAADTYGALWAGETADMEMLKWSLLGRFWEGDMPLWPILQDMKVIGIRCDVPFAQQLELASYKALQQYEKFWAEVSPYIGWTQNKELVTFFAKLGLPIQYRTRVSKADGFKKKVKTPSVDDEALKLYRDAYMNKTSGLILLMRQLKHAADFTHVYSSDERCHAQYKPHGQKMGRIQAKDPDIQNIPEEIIGTSPRRIFIPDSPDDAIIVADFSQIELWCYAWAAQDKALLKVKQSGEYVYGLFYEDIFKKPFFQEGMPRMKAYKRKDVAPKDLLIAKSGPLGLIYGRGIESLMDLKITRPEAQRVYKEFFKAHKAIEELHTNLVREADRTGFLRNAFGRIRRFPNARAMRNEILSFPGQTNAADILRQNALIPLHKGLSDFGARLIFTVHDSVGINCPKRALRGCVPFIRDTFEAPIPQMGGFWIPCEISVGPNWMDTIPYEEYKNAP